MGFLGKIFRTGVLAGGIVAAVKVFQKYTTNNPAGVQDPDQKKEALKQAATEVFQDAKQAYEDMAPGIQQSVNTTAQVAVDIAKNYAPEAVAKVQNVVQTVSEKAQILSDTLTGKTVDAEFSEIKDDDFVNVKETVDELNAKNAANARNAQKTETSAATSETTQTAATNTAK